MIDWERFFLSFYFTTAVILIQSDGYRMAADVPFIGVITPEYLPGSNSMTYFDFPFRESYLMDLPAITF